MPKPSRASRLVRPASSFRPRRCRVAPSWARAGLFDQESSKDLDWVSRRRPNSAAGRSGSLGRLARCGSGEVGGGHTGGELGEIAGHGRSRSRRGQPIECRSEQGHELQCRPLASKRIQDGFRLPLGESIVAERDEHLVEGVGLRNRFLLRLVASCPLLRNERCAEHLPRRVGI